MNQDLMRCIHGHPFNRIEFYSVVGYLLGFGGESPVIGIVNCILITYGITKK